MSSKKKNDTQWVRDMLNRTGEYSNKGGKLQPMSDEAKYLLIEDDHVLYGPVSMDDMFKELLADGLEHLAGGKVNDLNKIFDDGNLYLVCLMPKPVFHARNLIGMEIKLEDGYYFRREEDIVEN